jgi:hypothetical protein
VFALDLTVRDSLGFRRTGQRRFRCRANPPFLTFTENRYVPISGSKKTANCSYIERWDEKLNHIRYAREKSGRALLWHVNVSAGSDAGGDHVAPKLGVKRESLQSDAERRRRRDVPHSQSSKTKRSALRAKRF